MRNIRVIAVTAAMASAAVVGTAAGAGAAATPQAAQTARQYEGTVVAVDRPARTFRLRDTERGTVTIHVRASTSFERINGLGGLRAGMRRVEANVRRSGGVWVAIRVERSGGGGEHGGGNDDSGGDDRGRGRGSDDPAGDDNGGRGRGSDD
jgi:Domain of unknown function (DUF5666)